MRLEVYSLWSPDLAPPLEGEGRPPDLTDFRVFVQASIYEVGREGGEVFGFYVCSPSALARVEPGTFVTHTLVLERFSWGAIRARLDKLLMHAGSASTWEDVARKLSGALFPTDV